MSKSDRGAAARAAFNKGEADRQADNAAAAREEAEKNRPPVVCLGAEGACNVYWSRSSGTLHRLKANEHTRNNLYRMARFEEYARWMRPDLPPDDAEEQEAAIMKKAVRRLLEDSLGKRFNASRVRGRGVWPDDSGGWVYNAGASCWWIPADGGKVEHVDAVWGGYVYSAGDALPSPADTPLSDEEGRSLVGLMRRTWAFPGSEKIMSGWCVAGLLPRVLELSPHIWINAPADTGKTFFQSDLAALLGDFAKNQEGVPTEAGVRQDIDGDALPMMIDEVEPGDSEKGQKKINALLDLMRSASYGKNPMKKGSPDGTARAWYVKCSFALFSVANQIYRDSDSSRCLVLDLCVKDKKEREMIWSGQKAGRDLVQTPGFHGCLIARLLQCLPVMQENIAALRDYLGKADNVATRRIAIFSTLFSCYYALISRERVSQEAMQEAAGLMVAYGEQEEHESDFSRCLAVLLGHSLDVYGAGKMSVSDACRRMQKLEDGEHRDNVKRALNLAGLRWRGDKNALQVDKRADKMKRIFAGTQWSNGKITKVLAEGCREKGRKNANAAGVWLDSAKCGGYSPVDCIMIPASLVLDDE